jgi:tetratricopeptide (TPR) repeat protein
VSHPLERGVLPGLLRELYVERRTGMLRFERDLAHCSIRLAKGHIVYGAASEPALHMGNVVVAHGLLSQENRDRASDVAQLQSLRLGEALQALGIVDLELLEEFLGLHVLAILTHLFSWQSGSYEFKEEDPDSSSAHDFPLKMTTGELMLEAVRAISDRNQVLFGLGDLDRVVVASTNPLLRFQRVSLNPTDAFVLSRVDGTLTAREVVSITPLAPEAVEQSLLALLCTGMLEFASRKLKADLPASPQFLRPEILETFRLLPSRNHYELLGLTPDASDAEVKAAYFRLAKRFHPDVHHHLALADLEDKLGKIFIRLGEAYEQLSTPEGRAAYQAALSPPRPAGTGTEAKPPPAPTLSVEEMFERAKERFEDGKYWEALALLGEVVRVAPGGLKQHARLLMARAFLKYPDKERDAERELLEVVQAEPANVEALFLLGGLYQRRGHNARAEAMFRKVLELRPNHRQAIAQLGSLAPKTSKKEEGLLKKLFRKG